MRWTRTDWALLLAITLLGAILRFYALGETPPGFQFDEAYNAIDAEQVLDGNRPIFLPANGGREILYTYFQAALAALLGASVYTFRLASALWGTAGVAATYLLFRGILRRRSREMAAFGAMALAISYWHIHFSHFGIRVIMMPVLYSALFGAYWAAGRARSRRGRMGLYVLAGAIAGASVYANPTGRFIPIVLAAYTVVLLWREPAQRRFSIDSPIGGLLVSGVTAFVLFLPLGLSFYQHPDWFFGHASEVSVFAERVSGGRGALAVLAENALHVLGMFTFYGDKEWTHGIAGRPLLDWAIAVPFYLGLVLWGVRLFGRHRRDDPDGDALWLLLLWMAAMLAPSVLSDAAPNYSRTLPSLPASVLPIALGLTAISCWKWPRAWIGYGLAGALMAASMVITVYDYFVRFPTLESVYYAYDVDKADALAILRERGSTHQVYLSPLWGDHAPVRFLRQGSGIKTLDTADTLVFPAGRGAVYAFPGEETERSYVLATMWSGIEPEVILDRYGRNLLALVPIEAERAAGWPEGYAPQVEMEARFDDAPTLLGAQSSGDGPINLFWRAEASTYRDLTTFLHLIDADGNRVAQADKIPGNGVYSTPAWSPGERVMDRLYPTLVDLCAGGDSARAVVGWYEYAAGGARRPRLDAPGDSAVAGEFTLPVLALDEAQQTGLSPAVAVAASLGDIVIDGFTLEEAEGLEPGSPLVVDLLAHAVDEAEPVAARLLLGDLAIGDFELGPTRGARNGDVWCQRVRTRVPLGATEGSAAPLSIEIAGEGGAPRVARLGEAAIGRTSRNLVAHPAGMEIAARFGEDFALAGSEIEETGRDTVQVQSVWHALANPEHRIVLTVQVLGPDGALVAQADSPPGDRPANRWLAGEQVVDVRNLTLPASLPQGEYRVTAGLYDDLSLERLRATDAAGRRLAGDVVVLGTISK